MFARSRRSLFLYVFFVLLALSVFALPLTTYAEEALQRASFFQSITEWFQGLFSADEPGTPSVRQAAAIGSLSANESNEDGLAASTATTTVINQYITNPVVERIIEQAMPPVLTGVTQDELNARLGEIEERLKSQIAALLFGNTSQFVNTQAFATSQRINQLSNVTVDGISGITDADIPDNITLNNYLPLSGGTITNATTTAFFATTASSTNLFATTAQFGTLSVTGTLNVLSASGGYYLDGYPLLNASSTSQNLLLGLGNGGTGGLGQSLTSSGVRNTALGYAALFDATDALRNVAIGFSAGAGAISANENVMVGYEAGALCKYCSYSTAIGFQAFSTQTGTTSSDHAEDDLSVAIGAWAMSNTTYQKYGTAVGVQTLQNSASSTYDVAVGYQAMSDFNTNTTSLGLNTALGGKSMRLAGSGTQNTAVGWLSQQSVTGNYNTCVGSTCFGDLTGGAYNTALGHFAGTSEGGSNPSGFSVTTGTSSIFIGDYAGLTASASTTQVKYSAAIGSHATVGMDNAIVLGGSGTFYANVGVGTTSPYARLSVQGNSTDAVATPVLFSVAYHNGTVSTPIFTVSNSGTVSIASGSLDLNQYGSLKQNGVSVFYASSSKSSVFAGETAGIATFTGSDNAAFGHAALDRLTTGSSNTAVGMRAGHVLTTGSSNVAIGNRALANATSSSDSTAIGAFALFSASNATGASAGINNTAVGSGALSSNTSGAENTAVGKDAMGLSTVTGTRNAAFGLGAMNVLTSGIRNTALGYGAGGGLTQGSNNVFVGFSAAGVTTGSNNIVIGGNAISIPVSTGSNQLNIGNLVYGTSMDGTASTISTGNIGIGTTTPYARLTVWGRDTASTTILSVVNSASTTAFAVYGNGNATYAGSIFQSSDQRLKSDITELAESDSLAAINTLVPVSYRRVDQPDTGTNLGFIAQSVKNIFPSLVTVTAATALTPDGTYTVNYAGLIAPIVRSIQALSNKIDGFAEQFATDDLTFVRATGDEIDVRKITADELCLEDLCVSKAQLQALLAGAGASGGENESGDEEENNEPDTTPPTITVQGANPAQLSIGSVYSDLGATVTDDTDVNLGYLTYLDGALVAPVSIDTSAAASYTIEYAATDNAGNAATSTRTVIVEAL